MTILSSMRGGLVVSCQALPGEPLHGSSHMCCMALAAVAGGASAIIANGADDIAAIKACIKLPVIGVLSRAYPDSKITLTATLAEIDEIAQAGADMAGIEATDRRRPNGRSLHDFFYQIRQRYPTLLLMAEIATTSEAIHAQEIGFDCISSAAFGYTDATAGRRLPDDDFAQFKALRGVVAGCPLVAEGSIGTPSQAARALELGADIVTVGSAITRPQTITASFAKMMRVG